MALNHTQDNPHQWILRSNEFYRETAQLYLESDLNLSLVDAVDLLDRGLQLPEQILDEQICKIEPWKIASLTVTFTANLKSS